MKYDDKVIWMFKKSPFYIATIQDKYGKLIAIEIDEHDEDQTEHSTDD